MTDNDLAVGSAELKQQVQAIEGWEADYVSDDVYNQGATEIIQTLDGPPAPEPPAANACGSALYTSITTAGYGDKVSLEQCISVSQAVINAVLAARNAT